MKLPEELCFLEMHATHRPYETQEERSPYQSVENTVLLRRRKKIILGSRGREGPGRERGGDGKGWAGSVVGKDGRGQKVRKLNRNM